MSEYGKEKSLAEILQELVHYCKNNGSGGRVDLKLHLPSVVYDRFSLSLTPKERVVIHSDPLVSGIKTLYLDGGSVEFV